MQSRHTRFAHSAARLTAAIGAAFVTLLVFAAATFPSGTYVSGGMAATFDGGHFRVKQGETGQVEGDYATHGDQIQLTDKRGPWACTTAGEETGAYRWKYDGGTLTFSEVSDRCKDRSG